MKILAVGGGSGGHVTPVVAVLHELKRHDKSAEIRFWCDRGFSSQAKRIVGDFDPAIRVDTVVSGKLRRYHHLTFLQHFTIPSVFWPNVRDVFLVLVGIVQCVVKLIVWRPNVVFTKGGFVCLPVGWAAQLLRIPVVVHDSDAHPGLTNRLLAKRAAAIATGAPLEYYSYSADKTTYVGIPIGDVFRPFDDNQRRETKKQLEIDETRPLIVITGGGLGARVLNDTVALHLQKLLEYGSVILISGADQYDELRALTPQNDPRYQLHAFVSSGMADILGAADVVVSRAGATTLLELAALAKPTILVPNGRLTGGHQLKNAKVYSDKEAVIILDDEQFGNKGDMSLVHEVRRVLQDPVLRKKLATNIHTFARPHAASDMAALVLKAARRH
jgi:UDP-N-acetylglucosamine--N-acetylmuramyl-(pentapeptide) pyrophosphoryl-undecaprenol N-acetylglucosamine transferase